MKGKSTLKLMIECLNPVEIGSLKAFLKILVHSFV